jgi:hypothetical protein
VAEKEEKSRMLRAEPGRGKERGFRGWGWCIGDNRLLSMGFRRHGHIKKKEYKPPMAQIYADEEK